MGSVGANFSGSVFRKDYPIVIATNRASAVLLPVRLKYDSGGYIAGTVLSRNTVLGTYEKYTDAGSSGTAVAACVLFDSHSTDDFDSTATSGSVMAVGIFGGCTVFKDKLVGWDADALADLKGTEITDATGVTTVKF